MKCPLCHRTLSPETQEEVLPFCSLRCKLIDTKRWLNEEYSFTKLNKEKLEEEIALWEQASVTEPENN